MQLITLQAIPNQSFSIRLDGVQYQFQIVECNGVMAASVVQDGINSVLGQRLLPNYPVIPYRYLAQNGNFTVTTQNDDYPYYTQFGISQFLIYASISEIKSLLLAQ